MGCPFTQLLILDLVVIFLDGFAAKLEEAARALAPYLQFFVVYHFGLDLLVARLDEHQHLILPDVRLFLPHIQLARRRNEGRLSSSMPLPHSIIIICCSNKIL